MSGSPRAPRVLVLGTVLGQPMGGVRRHNAELLPRAARLLREHGGSLSVMEGREKVAFMLPRDVERIDSDVPSRPPFARGLSEGRAVRRAIDGRFDLVHTGHVPAPRRLGIPFTITIHDLRWQLETSPVPRATKRWAQRDAVRRAALAITVSSAVKQQLVALFGLDPVRVRVVANAADHVDPLPRAAGPDAPLLHVGHVEPRKNLELLLLALVQDPALPRLVLAGASKAGEEERLRALASRLGIASRVEFLGPFEDRELAGLYARAACVVLPSSVEGFGIPAIEAARARVPIAIADTIPTEVAGPAPTFSPDDPAACARAIRRALSATEAELDDAARRANEFSWDASARALVDAWTAASRHRLP